MNFKKKLSEGSITTPFSKKKKSKFSGNYVTFQALKGQPVSKPKQTKTINSLYFVSLCEIIYIYIFYVFLLLEPLLS